MSSLTSHPDGLQLLMLSKKFGGRPLSIESSSMRRNPQPVVHVLMWFWSQLPRPSQPAVVQAMASVSAHTVLSAASGPDTHCPFAVLQVSGPLQTLPSSLQVTVLWVWSHVPAPSQPAVVQALPSVSPQVVLSARSVSSQSPFAGLQAGIPLQTLLSSVQTVVTCPWSHVPAPSQPAVVQALPSVSPQVVLSAASGPSLHASMASSQNSGPSQTLPSEGQSTGVPGLHPLWRSVDAVNWALLGVVEQPPAPPLQVSTTVTVAWSPSGSGSAGWIV